MIQIRLKATSSEYLNDMGRWLDKEMPNPPLPENQRWAVASSDAGIFIAFEDDKDATIFTLKWA